MWRRNVYSKILNVYSKTLNVYSKTLNVYSKTLTPVQDNDLHVEQTTGDFLTSHILVHKKNGAKPWAVWLNVDFGVTLIRSSYVLWNTSCSRAYSL